MAIVDHPDGCFKKGEEFLINGLQNSQCKCREVEIDIGQTDNHKTQGCDTCGIGWVVKSNTAWFSEKRFAPIDEWESYDISELTELLTNDNVNV